MWFPRTPAPLPVSNGIIVAAAASQRSNDEADGRCALFILGRGLDFGITTYQPVRQSPFKMNVKGGGVGEQKRGERLLT